VAVNPIVLAPTTLGDTPPLDYIDAAVRAGYDGLGIRLHRSPGLPFFPVVGEPALMRQVKSAVAAAGLPVYDILSFYLQPEIDFETMERALAFGAELGARYALVIGDDPEWRRMVENFGRLCDAAAALGLTCAVEAPVNSRVLNSLPLVLKLIEDSRRENAVVCLDPAQFVRAPGHTVDQLRAVDQRLFPYTQITDTASAEAGQPRCPVGEGIVPLAEMLDILPQGLPLSLEDQHRDKSLSAAAWAQRALETTRRFLERYYAAKG
jgi:sugar phosphate isomerase/epimerase